MDSLLDAVKKKKPPPPPPARPETKSSTQSVPPNATVLSKRGLGWPWDQPESHFQLFFPPNLPDTPRASQQIAQSKVSWLLNWELWVPGGLPKSVEWVPCVRTASQVQDIIPFLTDIRSKGTMVKHLLGFNEPEIASQANLSADQAARLWRDYLLTAKSQLCLRLGSPGMCSDTALCVPWLDEFFASFLPAERDDVGNSLQEGIAGSGVDFLVLHWYGSSVVEMIKFLETLHKRYGLPIWLNEFACSRMGAHDEESTATEVSDFLKQTIPWLDATPWIERYAYFGNAQGQDVGDWVGKTNNFIEHRRGADKTNGFALSDIGSLYLQL
ncbi:hypothetical protein H2198_001309 [Neophaeococcomyces mojaviensis]|uniref:Uncharacterized protein n=1 Tax=Neophaeococcomyces mojaviensis TaxID=3383035 RepID=A0ACC3AHJ5_9EURO|nr:hypothetical protein H2198_001309 [Knufia sp. JES_112]